MRVLMVSDVYFPRINGVSTSIHAFRKDLRALGCETLLVAPAYPTVWADDAETHRVRSRHLPFDPEDRLMVYGRLLDRLRELGRGCDLIHVQTPFLAHRAGVRLARELGLPTVETYHTFFEEYLHHYLPFLPRALLRLTARRLSRRQCDAVDAVVSPSAAMAGILRGYGVRTSIEVLPTGLELAHFSGGDGSRFRAAQGIAPARPVLLHVGRVAAEKNIGFLLEMLDRARRNIPELLLIVAGEGPALPGLRRRARRLGLEPNLLFVGYLHRQGPLLDCYRAADAFVFASRTETQGLVLLEAMACGVPVVSTAVLGAAEVLEGAAGAVTVPEDVDAFAAAVVTLLRDPLRMRTMAVAARRDAARWSSPAMAGRMLSVYRRLVSGQRREERAAAGAEPGDGD